MGSTIAVLECCQFSWQNISLVCASQNWPPDFGAAKYDWIHGACGNEKLKKMGRGIDRLFQISAAVALPSERSTIIYSCEEVTRQEIDKAIQIGAVGPNQIKAYTRCGMGPCQGEICGLTVSEIAASATNKDMSDVALFSARFPSSAIRLSDLGSLQVEEDDDEQHTSMH